MGQIQLYVTDLRNRFPLSDSVVVLEPILKTAFESDMCKEEGLVSALLIHMGLLKVITLIIFSDRKCSSCLSWLDRRSPKKSTCGQIYGGHGACVLARRGWGIKCGELRVVRLKVSPCFLSRNIAARSSKQTAIASPLEYPIIKNNNNYNKSDQKHLFFVPEESFLLTMSVNRKVALT